MTVTTTSNKVIFTGNGLSTEFDFEFKVLAETDIKLYLYVPATEELTLLSTGLYTVLLNDEGLGGTVTYPILGDPIGTDKQLVIYRERPLKQEVNLSNQTRFFPSVVMEGLDNLELQIQQLNEQLSRAIKVSVADPNAPATASGMEETLQQAIEAANALNGLVWREPGIATIQAGVAEYALGYAPGLDRLDVELNGVGQVAGRDYIIDGSTLILQDPLDYEQTGGVLVWKGSAQFPSGAVNLAAFDTQEQFINANLTAGTASVEGRLVVADPAGNIQTANLRRWRGAGGDLPLTLTGTDSELSTGLAGRLQQAIEDVANGLYDRLLIDPKRDGTPYDDDYFLRMTIPSGKNLAVHFDRRAIFKPQTNFQHFAVGDVGGGLGSRGPFTITAFTYDAATWGPLSGRVLRADDTWGSAISPGAGFTVTTVAGVTTVTLTADPPAGATFVVAGRRPALAFLGTTGDGQRLTATGWLNIDLSRQGFVLASATGGGLSHSGVDYSHLAMCLDVSSGAGWDAPTLSRRGDSAYLPGEGVSTYIREVRAEGMNDLAVYATGGASSGSSDDGRGLHVGRLFAKRCHTGLKVVRQQAGSYFGRVDLVECNMGMIMGETNNLAQGGQHHIASIRGERMGTGLIDIRDQEITEGATGPGIRIDAAFLTDMGLMPDGYTQVTSDAQAVVRLAGASGVSVGYLSAIVKDWPAPAGVPAVLMNSGVALGNTIADGFVSNFAVGYKETGSDTNRFGNKVKMNLKNVAAPAIVSANSRTEYDLTILTEGVGGVVTFGKVKRAIPPLSYTPSLFRAGFAAPPQTVQKGSYTLDDAGVCTLTVEVQVNAWDFVPTGAQIRVNLPPGLIAETPVGSEQFMTAIATEPLVLPHGTFGLIAEIPNGADYLRFRLNIVNPTTGQTSQVIMTDEHLRQPVGASKYTAALKVSGNFFVKQGAVS